MTRLLNTNVNILGANHDAILNPEDDEGFVHHVGTELVTVIEYFFTGGGKAVVVIMLIPPCCAKNQSISVYK